MNERILLIDDSTENLRMISAVLRERGYQVSVATSGARREKLQDHR